MAVTRWRPDGSSSVGGRVALTTPFAGTCTEEDAASPELGQSGACQILGGNAGAVDWSLRSPGSEWVLVGQVVGSQTVGGPPSRTLPDGTLLRRGDAGLGAYVAGGKLGGEPFRFDVAYLYSSPTLELNPVGYLGRQNEHILSSSVRYVRPKGLWKLHSFESWVSALGGMSADGRWIDSAGGS